MEDSHKKATEMIIMLQDKNANLKLKLGKLQISYNALLEKHGKFMVDPDSFKKYWNEKYEIEN